jgi:predicted outer membrane protein
MSLIQNNFLAASIVFCPAFMLATSAQNVTPVSLVRTNAGLAAVNQSSENQVEDFITASANTAATNIADCNLALKRCSGNEIKIFSMRVMKEQQGLMKQIKVLAARNEIVIPFDSFVKRNNKLSQLSEDAPFDKIFLEKIIAGLENNIDAFRTASECDDRWIRLFVAESLPILENQLATARTLNTVQ